MIRQMYDSAIITTECHVLITVSSCQDTLIDSLRGQKYVDTQQMSAICDSYTGTVCFCNSFLFFWKPPHDVVAGWRFLQQLIILVMKGEICSN